MNIIDQFLAPLFWSLQNAHVVWLYDIVSFFGSEIWFVILPVCLMIYFWRRDWLNYIFLLAHGLVGSTIMGQLLKFDIHRLRPIGHALIGETGYSFPSGHATASMFVYAFLIVVLGREMPNRLALRVLQFLLVILILAIGSSRVLLGVHYPTDIIGGYVLGFLWLIASLPRPSGGLAA